MKIVNLTTGDQTHIQQAAEILVAGFKTHYPNAWSDLQSGLEEVKQALDPNRITRIAIDHQGKVLGWIGAIPEYNGNAWNIHPLVVDPDHQGQGVGSALVNDLERLLGERGAITLFLGTDDEDYQTSLGGADVYPDVLEHIKNIKNINNHPFEFYQKMGFVIVGIIPDANGYGKPDIIMAKRVAS
jgi:aminoglycoside 6'-N-acetyltransferase I